MSDSHPSFGSVLQWDPAGGTSYVNIGGVKDISGPGITRETIDVTDHDSSGGFREYIPGLADGGDLSFTVGFDPNDTTHAQTEGTGLLGDFESDNCDANMNAFKLILNTCSGSAAWTFKGFLTSAQGSTPVSGEQTLDVTVKIVGKPTLTVT